MNKFLVFLEQREGIVKKTSIDTWNRVQDLAALYGDSAVFGILAGPVDLQQLCASLSGKGVIYHASNEAFRLYNPGHYARLVAETLKLEACTTIFFADTVLSRDLAPKLSLRLKASLLSGCTIFDVSKEVCVRCLRPVYSGSTIASFVAERSIRIYTILSSAKLFHSISEDYPTIIPLETCRLTGIEELFPVVRRMVMYSGRQDVTEASIIVAGGRGMGGSEGFVILEQLAQLLGGAVGASRQAVDGGWRPHFEQIGQTGKTVAPALYLACGISGTPQHLAGLGSGSTVVAAINSDRYAPIFDVADYGIVGDVHLVLPKLLDALHEFLKRK